MPDEIQRILNVVDSRLNAQGGPDAECDFPRGSFPGAHQESHVIRFRQAVDQPGVEAAPEDADCTCNAKAEAADPDTPGTHRIATDVDAEDCDQTTEQRAWHTESANDDENATKTTDSDSSAPSVLTSSPLNSPPNSDESKPEAVTLSDEPIDGEPLRSPRSFADPLLNAGEDEVQSGRDDVACEQEPTLDVASSQTATALDPNVPLDPTGGVLDPNVPLDPT
ncbi:MAG: hypothetical protein AAFN41_07940, partial [Planctomycetota bacterium]